MFALGRTHTQIQSLILASFFSPIPDTRIRSSTEAKAPFFVRSSIIDWAMEGPMPESVCSSAALAVLMFTRPIARLTPDDAEVPPSTPTSAMDVCCSPTVGT